MLDLDEGAVHLSCEPGAGATTLCLSLAAAVLERGNRVIWLSKEIPDPKRSAQILGTLSEEVLGRLVIIDYKEDLVTASAALRAILRGMMAVDLLVVEDWCERYGRASNVNLDSMRSILADAYLCGVVFTSASYDDASGGELRRSKGGRGFDGLARTVFLYRDSGSMGHRILDDGGIRSRILITEDGFVPT
ncbi:MAG: hypothetical protein QGF28_05315 [Candidatus Thalassarchaeaceae archaeon]|nr:hypothetical protein [Euryarchaeota archaeon]MDP7092180.1 hypothetical protein [Candidatus Thalassarchaeaceae archaeon]MDP7256659.1 hypothetical protein [Candidatus Thalassarchaeaceae archaeon]MDP7446599.1 hypothetical protein [Candidatus Thalassarchaeaceae archaeon]MDP7649332.1 hypothetical protein [Candidatus Thalassarchaeaceae archaeon]